jgi:gas vesicle protein
MSNNDNAFGLIVGFGLGVGLALLFAPSSGDKTRTRIAKGTREGADYLKRQANSLRDSAVDVIDKGQEEVTRQAEALKVAVETGARAYRRAANS